MDSKLRIEVPLRSGGKKMKKRRELDALIAHSINKRHTSCTQRGVGSVGNAGATNSQDKLLSGSTDDPDDYAWTNVTTSERRHNRKVVYYRMCGPLLFIIATTLIVGIMYWLYFDLRQQIYDYRQKIEEVSATSKNLPDTLQKWHETSSYLIRNQSTILTRVNDLQQTIESLQKNLTKLEASVNAQQNYAKDEKLVADFGAKIESLVTDVDIIKDHYNTYNDKQDKMRNEIDELKKQLASLPQSQTPNMMAMNISEALSIAKSNLMDNINRLDRNISLINDTLTQKTKMLSDELMVHKTKLDDLLDRSENITSHVTTISNSWPEYKQKFANIENSFNKINNEIALSKNAYENLDSLMKNLTNICQDKCSNASNASNLLQISNNKLINFKDRSPLLHATKVPEVLMQVMKNSDNNKSNNNETHTTKSIQ